MYLKKDEAKKLKKIIQMRAMKIWIVALFITTVIILIQSFICDIMLNIIGIDLSFRVIMFITALSNLLIGFIKGFSIYGKTKKSYKKKGS